MLRAMRLRALLSQDDIADALSLDQSYVSRLERGQRPVRLALLRRYAKACGYAVSVVFRRQNDVCLGQAADELVVDVSTDHAAASDES